jgi:hypothetical protein
MPKPTTTKAASPDERRPLVLPPADVDPSQLSDRELLEMAIAATPDPARPNRAIADTGFARDFAKCNDRTLRRYLKKEAPRPLPRLLRDLCTEIVRDAAKKAARARASA